MTAGHDIAMALRAAYLAMHRHTGACLGRFGVTADQFVLLSALAGAEGVTQQELVRRTASDANTVRAMLVLLEGRGLVSRRPHPTDGRARRVTLTARGRRVYEQLWAASEPVRSGLLDVLPPTEARTFVALLARITDAMNPPDKRGNGSASNCGAGFSLHTQKQAKACTTR